MARSGINKVILVGNLGADPDGRATAGGSKVTTFSVATSESWEDKTTGKEEKNTEWHRVVLGINSQRMLKNMLGKDQKFILKEKFKQGSGKIKRGKLDTVLKSLQEMCNFLIAKVLLILHTKM